MRKLADYARRRGRDGVAAAFEGRSRQVEEDVRTLHAVIISGGSLDTAE
jgi:hypothetical protein